MRTATFALVLAAGCLAGCSWFKPIVPAPATGDAEFNATWEASLAALKEYRFVIDREDRRAGVITTQPMVGRHWFELWRPDAATRFARAEGTLQTIYRQATVIVRRQEETATGQDTRPAETAPTETQTAPSGDRPGGYVAEVIVKTQRSDKPDLQITSTAEAHLMFVAPESLGRSPTLGEPQAQMESEPGSHLVDLGRDEALERRIAARIGTLRERYARLAGSEKPDSHDE